MASGLVRGGGPGVWQGVPGGQGASDRSCERGRLLPAVPCLLGGDAKQEKIGAVSVGELALGESWLRQRLRLSPGLGAQQPVQGSHGGRWGQPRRWGL